MSCATMRRLKRGAFWTGSTLLLLGWLALTGALAEQITLPGWAEGAVLAIGAGLVVWGSLKSRVERLETDVRDFRVELEKRVTREMFTQAHDSLTDRLQRIEGKLDAGSQQ